MVTTFTGMPRISDFYGIVIWMYFDDHNPPHIHAEYGEYKARIAIETYRPLDEGCPAARYGSCRNGPLCTKQS